MFDPELTVLPRNKVLTGGGYVWEFTLEQAGWNELNCLDKYGYITGIYKGTNYGEYIVDVCWPALDITITNIFPDELIIGDANDYDTEEHTK